MEIVGIDVKIPFYFTIQEITEIISKHWPDFILEDDCLDDGCDEFFFYKNKEVVDAWEHDSVYCLDPSNKHYNEMIYVILEHVQTTIVVDSLLGDIKTIVEEISGSAGKIPRITQFRR